MGFSHLLHLLIEFFLRQRIKDSFVKFVIASDSLFHSEDLDVTRGEKRQEIEISNQRHRSNCFTVEHRFSPSSTMRFNV